MVLKKSLYHSDIFKPAQTYAVLLKAKDGGNSGGSTVLRITIEDVNDHVPVFDSKYYNAVVVESSPRGTHVTSVHASDEDGGPAGSLTYRLFNPPRQIQLLFALDNKTGEITLKSNLLDREKTPKLQFIVAAVDSSDRPLSSTAQVVVDVFDINDNSPTISKLSGSMKVLENSMVDTLVNAVEVNDLDDGANGNVLCYLDGDDTDNFISIQNVGRFTINVAKILDVEKTPDINFTLICRDNPILLNTSLTSSQSIVVTVIDVNDNVPQFERNDYIFSLKENSPSGIFVGTIKATDLDQGDNGAVTYRLINDSTLYFFMEPNIGTIRSKVSFDREHSVCYLTLIVEASDHGDPSLTNTTTVIVIVDD
ncbi:hypothetical protein HELRODRAFT_76594, partial [Helobdella robusta]|uniref:Cadherin domain-containing protein n=1 Tax=Helobdella robusta TaxID=6412 RepID=T1G2M1_HELRO